MLDRFLGYTSQQYVRAKSIYDRQLAGISADDGGRLQGEGLQEFLEASRKLDRWNIQVVRAELYVGSLLISASVFAGNNRLRAGMIAGGLLLFADTGEAFYRGLDYAAVNEAVEGKDYLDGGLIRNKRQEIF